uniref:NADH-ubiquinone oxidoreductase chain 1 n=1 Tax=Gammarus pisinnus TaxID=1486748 RepID=A0A517LS65_9CRUS|nr:NADH dehydrogenase subunit 1 [Gammarus pisinnus]QDS78475.1 NADH dehydrogenase subunit 1 [Gammarus pisinnus]
MEMSMTMSSYFIIIISMMVGVAFVTLMEQKILASSQIRVGPNYSGYLGFLQPFADAVKLLSKETIGTRVSSMKVYLISPVLSLSLCMFMWAVYPFSEGGLDLGYGVLFFMCVSGLCTYPLLSAGWASNCKYSMLGSLRAVAQMVSYEVSMGVVVLSLAWVSGSIMLQDLMEKQALIWNIFMFMPLGYVWFVSSLAETNRTPYDFAEGESELVSGFNTEYSSWGFTLIFMSEYVSILLMSMLFCVLFVSSKLNWWMMIKVMLIVFGWVWARASLPRYRYDKLMNLAWKSFLPVSLLLFSYYLMVGELCYSK